MADKKTPAPATPEAPVKRKSLFEQFKVVDTGGGDIVNLELAPGKNKFRLLPVQPKLARRHFDTPESAAKKAVPCRHVITDEMSEAYAAAKKAGPAAVVEYLESQGTICEYCQWNLAQPDMYTVKESYTFLVEQDGIVKVAEFGQHSILRGMAKIEEDEEYIEISGGQVHNLHLVIEKEEKGGKTAYTVGASPKVVPLEEAELKRLLDSAPDLEKLRARPNDEKWAQHLAECGAPKEGEKPKARKF